MAPIINNMSAATIQITRQVRFAINHHDDGAFSSVNPALAHQMEYRRQHHHVDPVRAPAGSNTFAAWPAMFGLGRYYELEVTCRGDINPQTGYLINIKDIDNAVRESALPLISHAADVQPLSNPFLLLPALVSAIQSHLNQQVIGLTWRLSPFYGCTLEVVPVSLALIHQQFEFSASHRLHCHDLDEESNRKLFGKCNNPNGHGHNYRLEVSIVAPGNTGDVRRFSLRDMEAIVMNAVIERMDHKYLNLDVKEFSDLNPTVENIARVCFDLMREPLRTGNMDLHHVTVWETQKTSCTYPIS